MAEYIERETLMKFPIRRDHCDKEHANEHFINGIETVMEYAQNLPVADVEPVRHGQWIWHEESFEYECSNCHCRFDYDKTYELFDHGFQFANYCPNCGATMDGGANGAAD